MSTTAPEYFDLGVEKYEAGLYEEALDYFDQAILLEPEDALAFSNRGLTQYCLAQYEAAIADFDAAIRINPEDAITYFNRGDAKAALKDYESAIADYDEAIRLNPDEVIVYFNRGDAKAALEDYESAIADYDEAIRLDPTSAAAYNGRGDAYFSIERYGDAMANYDKAIEIEPGFAAAYTNRGDTHFVHEDYDSAVADYDEAIRADPNFARAYTNRGDAKFALGEYESAIADYNEAIRLDPASAAAFFGRGEANAVLGNTDLAAADYDEAVRLNPDFATVLADRGDPITASPGQNRAVIPTVEQAVLIDPNYAPVFAISNEPPDEPAEVPDDALYSPESDFVRWLHRTDRAAFFENTTAVFDFYRAHPAPFLFQRILLKFADVEHFHTLDPLVDETRQRCGPMQLFLQALNLQDAEKKDPLHYYHALALIHFYMGDPIETCRLYEEVLDDPAIVGTPLSLMGQYYFIESAKRFHEPYASILTCALEEIETKSKGLIEANDLRELYYAGLILFSNGRLIEADDYFNHARAYLPAAYMRVLTMQALQTKPALIEAHIADLHTRETTHLPENQYWQGFPVQFFKPDPRDYFAPLLHYAHCREIAEALAAVRTGDDSFLLPELWEAFQWQPEAASRLEWKVRRQQMNAAGRRLSEIFKKNRETTFESGREVELARREEAFARQLEQDEWMLSLAESLEDFQRSAPAVPGLSGQLAALLNGPSDASATILLIEYFYLRGNLGVFEVFLMYFYIGRVKNDQPGAADKKLTELLVGPALFTGQVINAGTSEALVRLVNGFWAGEGAAVLKSMKYDDFVAHFLRYLGEQRETLGAEKFDAQYPLVGLHDWSKNQIT